MVKKSNFPNSLGNSKYSTKRDISAFSDHGGDMETMHECV